jgi:hypothetical protein
MYFLVKATIHITEYMGKETKEQDIRLVKADIKNEALGKYEAYWSNKTDEYSVYYRVANVEVVETIE